MPLNRCVITMLSDRNGLFSAKGRVAMVVSAVPVQARMRSQSLLASLERKADPRGGAKE